MKTLWLPLSLVLICGSSVHAQTLVQTFESGEDTSAWNSTWTNGSTEATFLSSGLGGVTAGNGTSATQSYSRSFKDNTAGIAMDEAYSVGLYVQLNTFDGPSGGQVEIINGDFGSGNAGDLRVTTTGTPGVFKWQARDQNSGWQDLDIAMALGSIYRVTIDVDPTAFTYNAKVELTDVNGNVLDSGSLANLAFDTNVINNNQAGNLLVYINASAGGAEVAVDNILITAAVPEPASAALLGGAASLLLVGMSRSRQRARRAA